MTAFSSANSLPARASPRAGDAAPFDFAACEALPDWRARVAWPTSHAESFSLGRDLCRALLAQLNAEADRGRRDILLLAGGSILAHALALGERARAIDGARREGMTFHGDSGALRYLMGRCPVDEVPPLDLQFGPPVLAAPRRTFLRRLMRVASWSSGAALPGNLLAPQAVAVSHNALLRDCAQRGGTRVGFRHAETIYGEVQAASAIAPSGGAAVAEDIVRALADAAGLAPETRQRFGRLLGPVAQGFVARAGRDLMAARGIPRLPRRLWAGSGGYWPARCISIETLRRGGEVRRFAHGGQAGLTEVVEGIALTELAVSTEFTCPTPEMAARLEDTGALDLIQGLRRPKLSGWRGDPAIAALDLGRAHGPVGRRRVLYGPTILLGPRQLFPPLLPDPVHLDWQFRLVEALQRLPVDLVCRPHPEGLLYGREHPLASATAISPERYEELLPEAHVLVFDYGQSTTFYTALCSDRPIVFIDFGNPLFTGSVRAAIERRCRVIRARFDARNRPQIDHEALAEAVCGGPAAADAGEFRAMFMARA